MKDVNYGTRIVDDFGRPIETTGMYRQTEDIQNHRVNVNLMPLADENVYNYIGRMRRASEQNSTVSESHFNGMTKIFFCHKNPATCWVCDLNTVQLFFTKMGERIREIPEIKELFIKTQWTQQKDGQFTWEYRP